MASFRAIQPAPSNGVEEETKPRLVRPLRSLPRRYRSVTQACRVCRQMKAKCDGIRPRCGNCVARNRSCGFEGEAGQSRQAAMRARLEALETLFSTLQARPPAEADRLLERIRAANDLAALARSEDLEPGRASSDQGSISSSDSDMEGEGEDAEHAEFLPGFKAEPEGVDLLNAAPSRVVGAVSPLPWDPARPDLPDASMTRRAIEAFFNGTGKLFQVFSPEQVTKYYTAVFGHSSGAGASSDRTVAVSCVAAVAAVGTEYMHGVFDTAVTEAFYEISRRYYEVVLEKHPLDAIKVSTLLAQSNVMSKATVALAYVEVGLGLSRRFGLDRRTPAFASISPSEWADYRKTWRTLMFFSSWLSFTLGYIAGNDIMFPRMNLTDLEIEDSSDIGDTMQTEMVKIAMLKADILRTHLVFKELTILSVESIMHDLQAWHRQLPEQMQLAAAERDDVLPVGLRRTVFHVHLLYLGAVMLLYRRIASHIIRARHVEREIDVLFRPLEGTLARNAEQGVLAAKQSSKVLERLMNSDGVFKRCWLVIFQAYTSCTVILHSVAQKQLHNFPPTDWAEDLEEAKACIFILQFCSTLDAVALKFHDRLLPLYGRLAAYQPLLPFPVSASSPRPATPWAPPAGAAYLLTIPQPPSDGSEPDERTQLSYQLLGMLCQPFGGPENQVPAEELVKTALHADPARYEYPQMVERLEWAFEASQPFRWDLKKLTGSDVPAPAGPNPSGVFLGSAEPVGWLSGKDFGRASSVPI